MKQTLDEYEARIKGAGAAGKSAALRELGQIGVPEVTTLLAGHLGESDLDVRKVAIRELGSRRGDARAVGYLVPLLAQSRGEPVVYAEVVRALARLGDERCVEPLLKQVDAGGEKLARLVIEALPELLLQVKNREILKNATGRLVALHESLGSKDIVEACYTALKQLTGRDLQTPAGYRAWWNDKKTQEEFLRERLEKR
jgi:HEAT repeat protein